MNATTTTRAQDIDDLPGAEYARVWRSGRLREDDLTHGVSWEDHQGRLARLERERLTTADELRRIDAAALAECPVRLAESGLYDVRIMSGPPIQIDPPGCGRGKFYGTLYADGIPRPPQPSLLARVKRLFAREAR